MISQFTFQAGTPGTSVTPKNLRAVGPVPRQRQAVTKKTCVLAVAAAKRAYDEYAQYHGAVTLDSTAARDRFTRAWKRADRTCDAATR